MSNNRCVFCLSSFAPYQKHFCSRLINANCKQLCEYCYDIEVSAIQEEGTDDIPELVEIYNNSDE